MKKLLTYTTCLALLCAAQSPLSAGFFNKKPPKVFGVEQQVWDSLSKDQQDKVIEGYNQRSKEKELRKQIEQLRKENKELHKQLGKSNSKSHPINAFFDCFGSDEHCNNQAQSSQPKSNLWIAEVSRQGIDDYITLNNGLTYEVRGYFNRHKWAAGQCVHLKSGPFEGDYELKNLENKEKANLKRG